MTDLSDERPPSPQTSSSLNSLDGNAAANPSTNAREVQVTLNLPTEIASAIQQLSEQPIDQQIVALLLQAVTSQQKPDQSQREKLSQSSSDPSLQQEIEQLKHRLSLLESLLTRVEVIEGKIDHLTGKAALPHLPNHQAAPTEKPLTSQAPSTTQKPISLSNPQNDEASSNTSNPQNQDGNPGSAIASIWMQVQQTDLPPASIPSTLQSTASCPLCQHRVMPFKSSGRVVCIKCGWTDKPRSNTPTITSVDTSDIHKLLEQAAIESLENMKPRKQSH